MKIAALEDSLKLDSLAGSESKQILDKFILYIGLIQDPMNIFRYMEQKAICIFFSFYWITKSEYLIEIGDYKNAFKCLEEADSRIGVHETNQEPAIDIKFKAKIYRETISSQTIRLPNNRRRTANDFQLMNENYENIAGSDEQKNMKLAELIETKYPSLRFEKQQRFTQKNAQKPKSWLFDHYEQIDKQQNQDIILQLIKIHHKQDADSKSSKNASSVPVKQNPERLFKSLNTPFKRRDPMKMMKTTDSVQMMKRKRKPSNHSNKARLISADEKLQNSEQDFQQKDSRRLCMSTVPVSGRFGRTSKNVKFGQRDSDYQIQRVRDQNSSNQNSFNMSRNTSVRRGILRNKSMDRPKLSLFNEQYFPIKKCQQRDIDKQRCQMVEKERPEDMQIKPIDQMDI